MEKYKTHGTCSQQIEFEVDPNGTITYCHFTGGCAGNTQGVSALITGMNIDDAISKIQGIQCRNGTSCPDQLSKALLGYKQAHAI